MAAVGTEVTDVEIRRNGLTILRLRADELIKQKRTCCII
jgi:hypothetical protein